MQATLKLCHQNQKIQQPAVLEEQLGMCLQEIGSMDCSLENRLVVNLVQTNKNHQEKMSCFGRPMCKFSSFRRNTFISNDRLCNNRCAPSGSERCKRRKFIYPRIYFNLFLYGLFLFHACQSSGSSVACCTHPKILQVPPPTPILTTRQAAAACAAACFTTHPNF
jgi:hypothetical protein